MSEELKPCPICKREHEIDIDEEFGSVMFRHKNFDWNKDNCLLAEQELSENVSVKQFIEAWNTRPIEDALRAENDRLREALREIANSAGIDGCGYTTGEGHSNCIWKARQTLNEVKE